MARDLKLLLLHSVDTVQKERETEEKKTYTSGNSLRNYAPYKMHNIYVVL